MPQRFRCHDLPVMPIYTLPLFFASHCEVCWSRKPFRVLNAIGKTQHSPLLSTPREFFSLNGRFFREQRMRSKQRTVK